MAPRAGRSAQHIRQGVSSSLLLRLGSREIVCGTNQGDIVISVVHRITSV